MIRPALLSLSVVGCAFDAGGIGHGSGLADGTETSGTSSSSGGTTIEATTTLGSDAETTGMVTSATTTTTSSTTTDDATGTSSDSGPPESETTTGEVDPCADPQLVQITLEAADAMLGGSMMLGVLGNGQQYLYTETANDGTATFSFVTLCADEYVIWGLVYDGDPIIVDIAGQAADRMQVDLGAASVDWRYGCGSGVLNWNWEYVGTNDDICLADSRTVFDLEPGEHSVVFTPTEGGTANTMDPGEAAALQRIIVTNDLDFVP
ncbi:MAG TPA: hypothetical protein VG755_13755 [Nannocystaceae bacterium]|nr:hypothetical protein [Nannocystaceae bacterium]